MIKTKVGEVVGTRRFVNRKEPVHRKEPGQTIFLRRRAVMEKTGLPESTMYALIAKGKFPRPVKIAERAVAWIESDIEAWQADRELQRNAAEKAGKAAA